MNTCSLSFLHSPFPFPTCSSSSFFPPNNPKIPSFSFLVHAQSTTRRQDRTARHTRIRKKVEGTPERPRLSVFRSNKHISVQVIDDTNMHTLASVSTTQKAIFDEFNYTAGPTVITAQT
ncbi:60S ribosomal protein L18 [Stylosanthes scabra]|uniref:60S ribosomal protein L18 n=1 Tax=Stylosanthes scabra TaxID=79078 RepID=A0ABU6Q7C3_9FABA|nr:60S ribosomal protein L18 [Stylosanthes scabra]